jgi:hypothetical protein
MPPSPSPRRLLHEPAAGGDQPQAVLASSAPAATRRVISPSEWPAMTSASTSSSSAPARRRAVDRGLRPAGAVGGALEQVGPDLLESELEQVRAPPFHGFAHVSRLAALAWKEPGQSVGREPSI